jgi:C1A family cysteine protease
VLLDISKLIKYLLQYFYNKMKSLAFTALSLILIGATVYFNQPIDKAEKLVNYIQYLEKFHKPIPAYNELKYRLEIFSNFIEDMEKHNSDPSKTWKMGINQFSDLTKEEFVNLYLDTHSAPSLVVDYQKEITDPVPTVDWRLRGIITPVKNQGKCGSCWAFAATAAHEAFQSAKQHRNFSLSEQQLVDCSGDYGNQGCNGGLGLEALNYIRDFGQTLNASYPYTAQNGNCSKK